MCFCEEFCNLPFVQNVPFTLRALLRCSSLNKNKPLPQLLPLFILSLLFFCQDGGQSSVPAAC